MEQKGKSTYAVNKVQLTFIINTTVSIVGSFKARTPIMVCINPIDYNTTDIIVFPAVRSLLSNTLDTIQIHTRLKKALDKHTNLNVYFCKREIPVYCFYDTDSNVRPRTSRRQIFPNIVYPIQMKELGSTITANKRAMLTARKFCNLETCTLSC